MDMNYDVGFPLGTDLPNFSSKWAIENPWGPWDERKSIGKPRCGISRTPASLDSTIATIWPQSWQPSQTRSKPVVRVLHAKSMQVRQIT